ncbi:vomeronasal type-2 receptor 26-like [Gastrophryne carolinensis]
MAAIASCQNALTTKFHTLQEQFNYFRHDLNKIRDRTGENERRIGEAEDRLSAQVGELATLRRQVTVLLGRAEDSENRNRRNNVRILGLPEKAEGSSPEEFVENLIPKQVKQIMQIIASLPFLQHLLVFMFAVEEINQRADILPNVTLGYTIYDSCTLSIALHNALTIISESKIIPNYSCRKCFGFLHQHETAERIFVEQKKTNPGLSQEMKTIFSVFNQILQHLLSLQTSREQPGKASNIFIENIEVHYSHTLHFVEHIISPRRCRHIHKFETKTRYKVHVEKDHVPEEGERKIGYGTSYSFLRNQMTLPSLHHMFPGGRSHYKAILHLLRHFGWTWVGIVSLDNEGSQQYSMELQEILIQYGICIEFMIYNPASLENFLTTLALYTCQVVIIAGKPNENFKLTDEVSGTYSRRVFIFPFNFPYHLNHLDLKHFNGSLLLDLHSRLIPGLKDFLLNASPNKYPDCPIMKKFWEEAFNCLPTDSKNISLRDCKGTEHLSDVEQFYYDVDNFRETFQIYAAIYSMAHALHEMYSHQKYKLSELSCQTWKFRGHLKPKKEGYFVSSGGQDLDLQDSDEKVMQQSTVGMTAVEDQGKLNFYLRNLHFRTLGGEEVNLNKDENVPIAFDILNFAYWPNSTKQIKTVGYYYQHADEYQLYIDDSSIHWNLFSQIDYDSQYQHLCARKAANVDITKFTDGGIRNVATTVVHAQKERLLIKLRSAMYMEKCFKCPDSHWSSVKRDSCIPRTIEFLSVADTLGLCLDMAAFVFCFLTVIVFGVFIKHKDTAIVKANNQNLSFILLLSLILSFLCPLLFVGRPTKMSCLFRQIAFGIIFTISVSSVLAKTVIVILAFRVTKPGWTFRGLLGKPFSYVVLIICSFGEVVICAVWLIFSPPFPEYNTQEEVGKIILQCNEGSVTAFYVVIGYMGCLALLSFIVAFFAKKLPDTFNEAQYITFSMLLFCSVWIAFIPAYLSTKGKYMVAVEIFAILASNAGLLGCIFIPKCYIILMRPDLNNRANLTTGHNLKNHT